MRINLKYSTVSFWLSGIQEYGILIQPAKISNKIYDFYKAIKKQICPAHMFANHAVVLQQLLAALPVILPHSGVSTVEEGQHTCQTKQTMGHY
jgi:hypothetical protein